MVSLPNWRDLEYAISLAQGGSLCVIEHPSWPLLGWAMASEARDLVADEVTTGTRAEVDHLLDDLAGQGYNGYSDQTGKRMAGHYLGQLSEMAVGKDVVLSGLIARGVSPYALDVIEKLLPARQPPSWTSRDW